MSAERRIAGAALVNGTALDYETLGEGPAVLLLHGGLGFDRSGFLPAFERLTPPYQVAAYDHRGNGSSGRPPLSTITMEQLADDAAAIIEALDLGRPVVVGHSYGGFVAQELALRHPHAVAGLVLVDTTPGHPGASDDREADPGPPPPPEALAPFERPPTNDEFRRMMRGMLRVYVHRRSWSA